MLYCILYYYILYITIILYLIYTLLLFCSIFCSSLLPLSCSSYLLFSSPNSPFFSPISSFKVYVSAFGYPYLYSFTIFRDNPLLIYLPSIYLISLFQSSISLHLVACFKVRVFILRILGFDAIPVFLVFWRYLKAIVWSVYRKRGLLDKSKVFGSGYLCFRAEVRF